MVSWNFCTMPKNEGGIVLINIATQGSDFETKWVVRFLEGYSPWHILMWHRILITQHAGKVRGHFYFGGIISIPQIFQVAGSFILESIWIAWRQVFGFPLEVVGEQIWVGFGKQTHLEFDNL